MKKKLLLLSFTAILINATQNLHAQANTAFAITGETKGNVNWTVIREVDLGTGSLVRNIYLPVSQKPQHVDAATGKTFTVAASTNAVNTCNCSMQSLSAASAYDSKQNRLYFTTLFGNDLQYIDLNQRDLKIFHVKNQPVKPFVSQPGEGDNITRMAFGSDGYGYALTNNGNHLIRFSTGKNIRITDLGSLKDGRNNKDLSVHTQAASWGGDMVADDAGNLFLFTVGGHVFKINPVTKTADFLGTIKNLPTPFSVNAAAVDKDGLVTISSSLDASNYYRVNLATLEAETIARKDDQVFNASDFANGNFITTVQKSASVAATSAVSAAVVTSKVIAVYPNPVENKTAHIYFNSLLQGKTMIEITELGGKKIAAVTAESVEAGEAKTIQLPASTTAGMYVVRVINADNKIVFSQQVMVH